MGGCQSRTVDISSIRKSAIDKFDERTLDDFRAAFNTFDRDGGGSIDAAELKDLMQSVGTMPTDAEIQDMIMMADADGSGSIDFAEFVTLMAHNMNDLGERTDADLRLAFNIFDRSGDGNISPEELQRIMINVGEPVELDDVNAVIALADEDGDGEINFGEFINIIIKGGREEPGRDKLYDTGRRSSAETPQQPTRWPRPSKEDQGGE